MLNFLYEVLNKENIFIFVAGFMMGVGCGKVLFGRGKPPEREIEKNAGWCHWSYKLKGQSVGLYRFFKKGKKCGIDCQYLTWRKSWLKSRPPHCELLDSPCRELENSQKTTPKSTA